MESVPIRGNSKCKGLTMGECLACWRNREEAGCAGAEIKGRGVAEMRSESKVRVCRTLGVTVKPLTFTQSEARAMRRF